MTNEETRGETRAAAITTPPQQRQMQPGTQLYPYGQQSYGMPYGQYQQYGHQFPYHHHHHPQYGHMHGVYGFSWTHPYYGYGMPGYPVYRDDQVAQGEGQQDYRQFPFMPFGYGIGYPRPFLPYGWYGGPFIRPPFII